jgi:hypothetical protein
VAVDEAVVVVVVIVVVIVVVVVVVVVVEVVSPSDVTLNLILYVQTIPF